MSRQTGRRASGACFVYLACCFGAPATPRRQEKELSEYKLYVAERYPSKEYLSETKREILDSIHDLARRIEHR